MDACDLFSKISLTPKIVGLLLVGSIAAFFASEKRRARLLSRRLGPGYQNDYFPRLAGAPSRQLTNFAGFEI